MKIKYASILLAFCLSFALFIGCQTAQRNAYTTIASAEAAATSAIDAYYTAVARGLIPTNDVPKVKSAYNSFQATAQVAASVSQNGSNALAPEYLQAELQQVLNLTVVVLTNLPAK